MINDKKLIEKIISQIDNLTFEEIDEAIKEVDNDDIDKHIPKIN